LEKNKKKQAKIKVVEVDLKNELDEVSKKNMMKILHKVMVYTRQLLKYEKKMQLLKITDDDDILPPKLSAEELLNFSEEELRAEITTLKQELTIMKPNMEAIKEYRLKVTEYDKKKSELDEITAERDNRKKEYDNYRKNRLDDFMSGFNQIRMKLSEMYKMITLDDGDADLEPIDSLDPFKDGISFRVRPPKKYWHFMSNLSGGEKTISSLSLIFALHGYKPTPFYIMDEIDAALDEKNITIISNLIKDKTKTAQFLVVSLRNIMYELSDRLVGIYKIDNRTKSISINPSSLI